MGVGLRIKEVLRLFQWSNLLNFDPILSYVDAKVIGQNNCLTRSVLIKEIKFLLFKIKFSKLSGLDGMPSLFFQKYWYIVYGVMIHIAKCSFIIERCLLLLILHILCWFQNLTPKKWSSLVKDVISKVIGINQNAFVPFCVIYDNILVAQDLLHTFKCRRHGKQQHLTLKLCMRKACYRIKWSSLEAMMIRLGFCKQWILDFVLFFHCYLFLCVK